MTQPLKPLNLLTINLKDESFHNSIEYTGLRGLSSSECSTIVGQIFQIKLFIKDLLVPPCSNPPTNFPHKISPPLIKSIFYEKKSPFSLGGGRGR